MQHDLMLPVYHCDDDDVKDDVESKAADNSSRPRRASIKDRIAQLDRNSNETAASGGAVTSSSASRDRPAAAPLSSARSRTVPAPGRSKQQGDGSRPIRYIARSLLSWLPVQTAPNILYTFWFGSFTHVHMYTPVHVRKCKYTHSYVPVDINSNVSVDCRTSH